MAHIQSFMTMLIIPISTWECSNLFMYGPYFEHSSRWCYCLFLAYRVIGSPLTDLHHMLAPMPILPRVPVLRAMASASSRMHGVEQESDDVFDEFVSFFRHKNFFVFGSYLHAFRTRLSPIHPRLQQIDLLSKTTKMLENTFLPNCWSIGWSFVDIGWYSTFVPHGTMDYPRSSSTRC